MLYKFYSYDDGYENQKSICSPVDLQYCVLRRADRDGFEVS